MSSVWDTCPQPTCKEKQPSPWPRALSLLLFSASPRRCPVLRTHGCGCYRQGRKRPGLCPHSQVHRDAASWARIDFLFCASPIAFMAWHCCLPFTDRLPKGPCPVTCFRCQWAGSCDPTLALALGHMAMALRTLLSPTEGHG